MFGIGPTEMIFFLVILLLAVGPEKLPTFMRTVGKGVRQVRNASREFKDAIGLDELMREGDPFRSPPVQPPRDRPVPVKPEAEAEGRADPDEAPEAPPSTPPSPPPVPPPSEAARVASSEPPSEGGETDPKSEPDAPAGTNVP